MADVGASGRHDARGGQGPVDDPARRRLLVRLSLGASGLIAAMLGLPVLGYLLAPLFNQPRPRWVGLGSIDQFAVDSTVLHSIEDISPLPYAGLTAATAVYVRRTAEREFAVFAVNCTHLGCPVNWLAAAQLFLCPCHGGVFYTDGSVAAGPPQHPLYRYDTRVEANTLYALSMPLPPSKPWSPPRLPGLRPQAGSSRRPAREQSDG